jgi:hypothetical protein
LSVNLRIVKGIPLWRDLEKLVQLGNACKVYADENGGAYPPDWSCLNQIIPTNYFRLGRNSRNLGGITNVMAWTDFVYMRGLTTASPSNAVLAFLPPGQYPKDNRGVILFADLHVESVTPDQFTRKMNASQRAIHQANLAYTGRRSDLAWVSRDIQDHPDAHIDWVTVTIRKGTNETYWAFGNGKPLNRDEFEKAVVKLRQFGIDKLFVYGEDEATVQQVNLTLDILEAHSITNVLLFTRVQGVIDPPFKMPESLKLEVVPPLIPRQK